MPFVIRHEKLRELCENCGANVKYCIVAVITATAIATTIVATAWLRIVFPPWQRVLERDRDRETESQLQNSINWPPCRKRFCESVRRKEINKESSTNDKGRKEQNRERVSALNTPTILAVCVSEPSECVCIVLCVRVEIIEFVRIVERSPSQQGLPPIKHTAKWIAC